jgi:hypothetical protein
MVDYKSTAVPIEPFQQIDLSSDFYRKLVRAILESIPAARLSHMLYLFSKFLVLYITNKFMALQTRFERAKAAYETAGLTIEPTVARY